MQTVLNRMRQKRSVPNLWRKESPANICTFSGDTSLPNLIHSLTASQLKLRYVALNFEIVDEIQKCNHSNESYWAVISSAWYCLLCCVQGGSSFYVCGWNPKVWPFKMKAIEPYFPVVLFVMLYKVVLTFEPVDEILKCDHSNESYWAVLSCGAVYYAVQGVSTLSLWMKS